MTESPASLRGLVAMAPDVVGGVLPADLFERLQQTVHLCSKEIITDFRNPDVRAVLQNTDVLITGWGCPRVDERVLNDAPELVAVFHLGGSVKGHLDVEVWRRGITVSAAADAGADPVAEFTLAAITFAGKRVIPLSRQYSANRYPTQRERASLHDGIHRVGVIGASRIGRRVIRQLIDSGYAVAVSDPTVSKQEAHELGADLVDVDELCRSSDVVTVHAPNLPATRHLIDARRLALMRDRSILINTARGQLVDTEALTRVCTEGRIDAVLDVTDPEPLPRDHPLLTLPNVLVTPHISGVTGHQMRRLGEYTIAEVERYVRGERLQGVVHRRDLPILA